ncbi:Ig-like domain-containing protein [Oceanirhabdus sp. W0125-5]|uniref:Ig-like domain-containing protein n=1 Tax=Oceanirhabdus sp. W0125-5 TaxID=2999116 RepID=UPI0022F2A5A6|nr:Ig-like domain-containing protein [Oceanirhabdus sp. W0125-5]WBW95982.1 Ig-like domain-containing protein [Oceanirhabdus sp. W0125-5]
MKKAIKGIFLVAALTLSLNNSVNAAENKLINKNKIWKVTFSDNVDISTVEGKVYVSDEEGHKIYLDGAVGEKSNEAFFLPPENGYKPGEKYLLHIEAGVSSQSGTRLGDKHTVSFTVKDEPEMPKESYEAVTVNIIQYDNNKNIIQVSNGYMIDDKIIAKIDLTYKTSWMEIGFENGNMERVNNIINWNNQHKLFTFRYNEKGFLSIQSKNSAHVKWLTDKLDLANNEIIYDNLIEKDSLTLADIKGKLFKEGSLLAVQNLASQYYSSEKVGLNTLNLEKIYLEKDSQGKKINTYLAFDNKNSKEILRAFEKAGKDFNGIKEWVARINNYVKNNYLEYTVEGKVMLTLDEQDIMQYFNSENIYYDGRSGYYYPKEPFITHININSEDYFIIRK